ncbi:MAG: tyrosinase family protein [Chloroflexia bacterium]|nr:tyrosinase family protein [Chloroflexia bacterium]
MQQRAANDPRSWAFQASIHQDNCKHNTLHFLSWHRMYLYWFERILRDAVGDEAFALPYWNYSTAAKRILPIQFRTKGNPLYVSQRSDTVNDGQQPSNTSIFDTTDAMAALNFTHTGQGTSFGGRGGASHASGLLEQTPHNPVHLWIGGYRAEVETAALDPVSWLHHANIDHLWEKWLRQGDGRANPTGDAEFMGTSFTFYDEGGNPVQMTGVEILDTVEQLDYRYDDQPAGGTSFAAAKDSSRPVVKSTAVGATAKGDGLSLGPRPATVAISLRAEAATAFSAADRESLPRTTLTLEGVAGGGVRGVMYHVHVGAKQERPSANDPSYVGLIGLFGPQPSDHGGHTATMSYDITNAVAAAGGKKIAVTLVPVDLTDSGRLPGGTGATIERMLISVEGAVASGSTKERAKPKTKAASGRQRRVERKTEGKPDPRRTSTERPERKRRPAGADKKARTSTRKRKRSSRDQRSPGQPNAGPNNESMIPGDKRSAVGSDLTGTTVAGHAQH